MNGTWTGAGLLAASLLALPLTARADDRDWRDDDRYRNGGYQDYRYDRYGRNGRNATFGYGFDRGFQEGQKQGIKDVRGRRTFDPARHGEWRDTDKGYRSSYGPRYQYENGYRSGFQRGYRIAFDQSLGNGGYNTYDPYGRYDPNGRYGDRYDPYGNGRNDPYERYDAYGRPDPNGRYDRYGNRRY